MTKFRISLAALAAILLTAGACFLPESDDIYPDESEGDDDDSAEEVA